jgi:hypothetical protein
MSNQGAQGAELVVPVLRQLPQQSIRLRLGQRQLTEESKHGTRLVERDANEVHQKGEHHQDFDAVLATRRDAGDARFFIVRPDEDAIANTHRFAVFDTPHRAFPHQLAIAVTHTVRINIPKLLGVGEFDHGRLTPW